MARFFSETELDEMVRHFDVQGYLRVENALTADQMRRLDQAVDQHLKDCPGGWMSLSDSFCEAIDVLPHTAAFDEVIESPLVIAKAKLQDTRAQVRFGANGFRAGERNVLADETLPGVDSPALGHGGPLFRLRR